MIVRVHKVGSSFKGCAAYLLHDKDAATAERVGWVATHNLGTDNPQTAWRVMAATALQHNELKQAAGIKATGQKMKGAVLHYSLSWKGVEDPKHLTQEAMLAAATRSLSAIGVDPALFKPSAKNIPKRRQYADEHQAMIVCHTDEEHPHVHVMVNRVHPEHGCILPSGKERDKLSRWANDYEHDTGMILCQNRADNWDQRNRGIWVKHEENIPRHTFEMTQEALGSAANDNSSPALERLKAAQRAQNDALAADGAEQAIRQREAWLALSERYRRQQKAIREQRAEDIREAKQASADEYRPLFSTMRKRHEREREEFKSEERSVIDEISHAWKSVKLLARLRGEDSSSVGFGDYFAPFAGAGAQFELKLKEQAAEKRAIEREQEAKLAKCIAAAKQREKARHKDNTDTYATDKTDLMFVQRGEDAALRARWKARHEDQRTALAEYVANSQARQKLKDDYARNALAQYGDDVDFSRGPANDQGKDDGRDR